jgi:hypothetical protein
MAAVSTSLDDRARTIFTDLGYEVTPYRGEFRAERKWRTVYVTTAAPAEAPNHGSLRCFVVPQEQGEARRQQLYARGPDYDWAVISVNDSGYDVLHPSAAVLTAP